MMLSGRFYLIADGVKHLASAISGENAALVSTLCHIGSSVLGMNPNLSMCGAGPDTSLFLLAGAYARGVGVNREIIAMPIPGVIDLTIDGLRPILNRLEVLLNIDIGEYSVIEEVTLAGVRYTVCSSTRVANDIGTCLRTEVTISVIDAVSDHSLQVDIGFDLRPRNRYLGGGIPDLYHRLYEIAEIRDQGDSLRLRVIPKNEDLGWLFHQHIGGSTPLVRQSVATHRDGIAVRRQYSITGERPVRLEISSEVEPPKSSEAQGDAVTEYGDWASRWKYLGSQINSNSASDVALGFRYAQFQLMQHGLPNSQLAGRISPARGLTSTYHSGATFFDTELHRCSYWTWTAPQVTLRYLRSRLEQLPQAQMFADSTGYRGARYPEAVNDSGTENGPHYVLIYPERSTHREHSVDQVVHISADICFAIAQYVEVTGDDSFLHAGGWRIIAESARFAASALRWSPEKRAYTVANVMGPDEYHYSVKNSYFTNYMLRWTIEYGLKLSESIDAFSSDIDSDEARAWRMIATHVFLPSGIANETAIPGEFEGYFQLPDTELRRSSGGVGPRFIAEHEAVQARQLSNFDNQIVKQADIILLMSLFPDAFPDSAYRAAYEYYEPRTVHDSSLSYAPYGIIAAWLDDANTAAKFLGRACRYNLDFSPAARYANGLHLSAYAGAWQILVLGLAGLRDVDGVLRLAPLVPDDWHGYEFPLVHRRRRLRVAVTRDAVDIYADEPESLNVQVERIPLGKVQAWH